MQKFLVLSLLVMSSSMYTMEKYSVSSFFSYLRSFVCSDQNLNESELIQGLRANKNKFEEQLQLNKWDTEYMNNVPNGLFSPEEIDKDPINFLKFCYWQDLELSGYINVSIRQFDEPSLLYKCKNARIDGYSALGAAIIAKDVQDPCKGGFILELKDRGYTLTEKDKELLVLELYDAISVKDKEIMILMLCNHKMSNLSVLPHDVRNYIVQYMIASLKDKHISVMDMGKHNRKLDLRKCMRPISKHSDSDMMYFLSDDEEDVP